MKYFTKINYFYQCDLCRDALFSINRTDLCFSHLDREHAVKSDKKSDEMLPIEGKTEKTVKNIEKRSKKKVRTKFTSQLTIDTDSETESESDAEMPDKGEL